MIFNTFIFMQVFNEINCRKIGENGKSITVNHHIFIELNVFESFFNNPMFLFIVTITVGIQIILIQFGGEIAKCTPLTVTQHLICIVIGFFSLVFGYLAKKLPLSYFANFRLNEESSPPSLDRNNESMRRSFRKSRTLNRSSTYKINQSQTNLRSPVKLLN